MTVLADHASDNILALLADYVPHEALTAIAPVLARLFYALGEGHSFIYVNQEVAEQLFQAAPLVGEHHAPLILRDRRLFLGRMFQLEQDLAREIKRLATPTPLTDDVNQLRTALQNWFPDAGSRDQQAAAALALVQNFTVLSGGPGTGKTTTVAKLLALLCGERLPRVALAAPTGKAAARMSAALKRAVQKIPHLPSHTAQFLAQLDGQTVHRLLGLKPPQMQPEYHAQHRLPVDIVVIDEASMLDTYLLLQLLQALPTHCRVILLGDEHQLPSVNAGAVLSALVQSRFRLPENDLLASLLPDFNRENIAPPVARLTISHRFGADSGIGCLARAVVQGEAQTAWQQFDRFPDALQHAQLSLTKQAALFYETQANYWQAIDNQDIEQAFQHQTDTVVLAARRNDTAAFNEKYRQILQTHGRASADKPWFAGQMLIITRNDPATQLFNGDVGLVLPKDDGLMAWFPASEQGFRAVPLSRLPAHEAAFAMTVHKSQGSEYETVWLLPPQSSPKKNQENEEIETEQGFGRALLYTAITRAKQRFVYWGDERGFQAACEQIDHRRTALSLFLREM